MIRALDLANETIHLLYTTNKFLKPSESDVQRHNNATHFFIVVSHLQLITFAYGIMTTQKEIT